jgi:DTW domain-containing protein
VAAVVTPEPRAVCPACRRPSSVCYCAFVTPIPTKTRVVVLQHPRERDMPIGTAHMATLCLPGAELHEGVFWDDARLARILEADGRTPVLLYPGEGAKDIEREPPQGDVTLVVVDGTWWQARKIVRKNPRLARLPRYAFTPDVPSQYRIRREPDAVSVSTIEALVYALGALEGDRERFEPLRGPFRAMIDRQIACERELRGARVRHAKKPPASPLGRVHRLLRDLASDVVCVVGEANAWPYRLREDGLGYDDELVHWVAVRLSSGETFERVVAPSRELAPRTTSHVELSEERLRDGATLSSLVRDFAGFLRETDVVGYWGHYAAALFMASGGSLPARRVDLRAASRDFGRARVGTLEEHTTRLGVAIQPLDVMGRGGRRLSQLRAVTEHYRDIVRASSP